MMHKIDVRVLTPVIPGTAAKWAASTTIPPKNVLCVETDTGLIRIGDGVNLYSDLKATRDETVAKNGHFTKPVTIDASDGNIDIDMSLGNVFIVETVSDSGEISQNVNLNAISNVVGAGIIILYIKQDSLGGHNITLNPSYFVQNGEWSTDPDMVNQLYLTLDGSANIDLTYAQRGETL